MNAKYQYQQYYRATCRLEAERLMTQRKSQPLQYSSGSANQPLGSKHQSIGNRQALDWGQNTSSARSKSCVRLQAPQVVNVEHFCSLGTTLRGLLPQVWNGLRPLRNGLSMPYSYAYLRNGGSLCTSSTRIRIILLLERRRVPGVFQKKMKFGEETRSGRHFRPLAQFAILIQYDILNILQTYNVTIPIFNLGSMYDTSISILSYTCINKSSETFNP